MKIDLANLPDNIDELKSLLANVCKENVELREKTALLQFQVDLYLQQRYGRRKDYVHPNQLSLFNEVEQTEEQTEAKEFSDTTNIAVKEHLRRTIGRPGIPDHLPRVDVIHDLPEAERTCTTSGCGQTLKKIGEEVSEQLDIIPAVVRVLRHLRYKYACPCCANGVRTATMPKQPLPKSNASPGLLAHIATAKYQDALPLYRQEAIMGRLGVDLSRSTTARWMIECGKLVTPIINLMRDRLIDAPIVNADETRIQVLNEEGRESAKQSWMWVQVCGAPGRRVVLFEYNTSRSQEVPATLLAGFMGFLQVDGYDGYKRIAGTSGVTRVGCWAHARRKFTDALKSGVKGAQGTVAGEALTMIGKLYAIEKDVRDIDTAARFAARQERAIPILSEMRRWLDKQLTAVPPKTPTGKALSYLDNEWTYLARYTEHGDLSIDNNVAERAIKPFAVGRKNWMFADTASGANASAALYSLVETAKANNIEPYAYLNYVFTRLPSAETVDAVENLLPWNCKLAIASA